MADALFTHRNTVNYRMQKIHALLHDDLASARYRFELQMAFYIQELLRN